MFGPVETEFVDGNILEQWRKNQLYCWYDERPRIKITSTHVKLPFENFILLS